MTLLTRPGCHLCDEARSGLDRHLAGRHAGPAGIAVEEIDIETDHELHRRYLERIPVIMVEGVIVSEFAFDPAALDLALDSRQRRPG